MVCFRLDRDPWRGIQRWLAHQGPLRLGAARRHEARAGVRLWRGARPLDADLDAGPRLPSDDAGEPAEVPAMRVTAGARGLYRAANHSASERIISFRSQSNGGYGSLSEVTGSFYRISMRTSAECRKLAAMYIKRAEREPDERRANALISAANAWLLLARGVRRLELNSKARKDDLLRSKSGPG